MPVKAIPEGYHTFTPYLIVKDAARGLEYYKQAFGATEVMRLKDPGGKVMHAEFKIGDSIIMLADEFPEMSIRGPLSYGGSPVILHLYVEDVDSLFRQALAAGATELRPIKDQFYGDRTGTLTDPFGHVWTLATHKEDLSPEVIHQRFEEGMKKAGSA